eukprot:maker-scaffold425_size175135-snap-gene-0.50 protein:Tk05831 transcript:maker-scaffold425_size175135-snap-gene-0.50-mRNA-1 annotation:"amino acid permease -like isoform 1"
MAEGGRNRDEETPLIPGQDDLGGDVQYGPTPIVDGLGNVMILSPGGRSFEQSLRSVQRDRMSRGRSTGRVINPQMARARRNDVNDPLRDVRAPPAYENLVDTAGANPECSIVRNPRERRNPRDRYYEKIQSALINSFGAHYEPERPGGRESINRLTYEPIGDEEEGSHMPFLTPGAHVLPSSLFEIHIPLTAQADDETEPERTRWTNSGWFQSLITIGAIWNTMIGTSLLAMPWAMEQSGIIAGPLVAILVAMVACYSATRILIVNNGGGERRQPSPEFAQLCGQMLGGAYEPIVGLCSLGAVAGAAIVYWVLMSNFLYHSVVVLFDVFSGSTHGGPDQHGLICAINPENSSSNALSIYGNDSTTYPIVPLPPNVGPLPPIVPFNDVNMFDKIWNHKTVPLFLAIPILPLINLVNPETLQKFNCIGTVNIFFLVGVVIYFASTWGINIDLSNPSSAMYVPLGLGTVYCLSGTLSLGMFIHNAIITITSRRGARPENNVRDTKIAFLLVLLSYVTIGLVYYISFPLPKNCIADNFLNNFHALNPIMAVSRGLLLLQLVTVFPIIMLILRNQMVALLPLSYHQQGSSNRLKVLEFFINVSFCILFIFIAIAYPNIGTIIRYSGAACGAIMMFICPMLCYMMFRKEEEGSVVGFKIVIEATIIALGVLNLVAQFLPPTWFQ